MVCVGFLVLAVAGLLGVAVPGLAWAQMLKCERHSLYVDDADLLQVAARAAVPRSAHIRIRGACVNPGGARGWSETQKIRNEEGVQQWWKIDCSRELKEWKCDPAEFKQLMATSVIVGGVSVPIELSFDKQSSLKRSRVIATRAIEVYANPASPLPSCGDKDPKEPDRLGAHNHTLLPTGGKLVDVSVSKDASVTMDDVDVDIEFPRNPDDAGSEALCWWQVVIVT